MTTIKPFLDDMLSVSTNPDGRTLQIHFCRPVTKEDRQAIADAHNAIVRGEFDFKLKYEDLVPEMHDMTASRDQYREENSQLRSEMDKLWSMFVVQCESIENRDNPSSENDHAKGFVSGERYAAKSIRRSVDHPKYNPSDFPAYGKAING
ncbi:hypothetical protein BMW22_15535 [Rhizobium leguminosarum]|uniref:Uncharacterized protein n=1 Tax=Rhizobium leguminosarum TaxID=384 RepID=A0A1L3ZB47_RHILE|nr:hypothetical protein [Rhizobium leguminosarum]API52837.1 hypothetical protein BMW22_15535 [Rhizobium leguminosarum]